MDEKRVAELRLIQAALAFHMAEIAYQKSVERAGIFSVEDRLHGKGDYEAERGEYIKRRVELTLACEQYAKLFELEKPAPENKTGSALNRPGDAGSNSAMRGDYTACSKCGHPMENHDDVIGCFEYECECDVRKPAPTGRE